MYKSLRTAATGMSAQQRKLDVTANNIANVNTTGYKTSRAEFQELLYEQQEAAGDPDEGGAPTGVELGSGVRTASTLRDFSQGTLEQTGNPLDLAIEGSGFFRMQRQNGDIVYSRAGAFRINARGDLVNPEGLQLDPPVQIPEDTTDVAIDRDGRVTVRVDGSEAVIEVGLVELSTFANSAGLKALGRGLYEQTEASGIARQSIPGEDGAGELSQGFLEGSNVEVTEEMIDMIVSQRAYEVNSKVIRTADEMLRSVTNIR